MQQVSGEPQAPDANVDVLRHNLTIDLGGILTCQLESMPQQDTTLVCEAADLADPGTRGPCRRGAGRRWRGAAHRRQRVAAPVRL